MDGDSGILDFKDSTELSEYMENLGLKFEFTCLKERNPISCHSLAQWYENYKRCPEKCAEVSKDNCFDLKFGMSCQKYGIFKLFGRPNVPRDPLAAFQAFEYGCKEAKHAQCCQAAARLIAEGISSHAPSLSAASPLFERGCELGLGESCFHLGGVAITMAQKPDATSAQELRLKAFNAWLQGCKLGHELSCRNVARMYASGDGIPVDERKAKEFTEKAEELSKIPKVAGNALPSSK